MSADFVRGPFPVTPEMWERAIVDPELNDEGWPAEHRAWPSESGRVPGCTCWAEPCCESCGEPWPCPDARG